MPTTLLFVDDEPDVEVLMRQRFRRNTLDGVMELKFARNGQEALTCLEKHDNIDLVVTDINMPVMDGLSFISQLKQMNRAVKVIVVSAYGDIKNLRSAMNRGAFDFVTKPINFGDLLLTIDKAKEELERLKSGEAAQRRLTALQGELQMAARIQQSMLPRTSAVLSGRRDVSVHAEMIPAKLVGGDFYDFFPLDEDHLAVVIGDVSGKGVPAALFMASARTLIRATALHHRSPGACLESVNHVLSRDSDPAMFLTLFYGVLELSTGKLQCAIGGHNPPVLLRSEKAPKFLDLPGGMIVGAFTSARFETETILLEVGDGLILYTDGVTEANDEAGVEFSEESLLSAVTEVKDSLAQEIANHVLVSVKAHTQAAIQSDDITVIALRYLGPGL